MIELPPEVWTLVLEELIKSEGDHSERFFTDYCFVNKHWFQVVGKYHYNEWEPVFKPVNHYYKKEVVKGEELTVEQVDNLKTRYWAHLTHIQESWASSRCLGVIVWALGRMGVPNVKLLEIDASDKLSDRREFFEFAFCRTVEKVKISLSMYDLLPADIIFNDSTKAKGNLLRQYLSRCKSLESTEIYWKDNDEIAIEMLTSDEEEKLSHFPANVVTIATSGDWAGTELFPQMLRILRKRHLDKLVITNSPFSLEWSSSELMDISTNTINLKKLQIIDQDQMLMKSLDKFAVFLKNARLVGLLLDCTARNIDWDALEKQTWSSDTLAALSITLWADKQSYETLLTASHAYRLNGEWADWLAFQQSISADISTLETVNVRVKKGQLPNPHFTYFQ